MNDTSDDVMFSRGPAIPGQKTEVRFLMDAHLAQALDALAFADGGKGRPALMEAVLEAYAKKEIHRSMVSVRMLRGNPMLAELSGETTLGQGA